jgi:uncharacterized SAM-binding protein YcdF (DUF218 family)
VASVSTVLRVLGALTIAAVLATAFTRLSNTLDVWLAAPPDLREADAIVVLGGAADPELLKDSSLRRAVHGMRLYARGLAPLLLLSGRSWESAARIRLAHDLGLGPQGILTLPASSTTREEAQRIAPALRGLGVRTILLVSDPHHLNRARGLFTSQGFEVRPAPVAALSPHTADPDERLELMRRTLLELSARIYYRALGSFSPDRKAR